MQSEVRSLRVAWPENAQDPCAGLVLPPGSLHGGVEHGTAGLCRLPIPNLACLQAVSLASPGRPQAVQGAACSLLLGWVFVSVTLAAAALLPELLVLRPHQGAAQHARGQPSMPELQAAHEWLREQT